jgi:hypothetical protein
MRCWCSNSRSHELQKVLALRLGCGHIGKGAEEKSYTLSHLQFHVSAIAKSCGIAFEVPNSRDLKSFMGLHKEFS